MASEPGNTEVTPEQSIRDSLGPEGGFTGLGISEAQEQIEELKKENRTDSLSGLLNRQGWEEAMKREYGRAIRYHTGFSIAMMDVDDFKAVNDTYGHPAGDEVIRRLGQGVRERFRDEDVKGRYGGDEIIVMLVGTHFPASEQLITEQNKISSDLMAKTHQGVSVGLVQWDGVESLDQAIERADKKLYEEKQSKKERQIK